MSIEISGFLLSSAEAYGKAATDIFNMFLTVLFSSFAFAAALPLRDIGKTKYIFSLKLSSSSIVIGGALAAFYIISFISFQKNLCNAQTLLQAIKLPLPKEVAEIYKSGDALIGNLGLPSLGFIIGATCGLIVFLWVTNVERSKP
tara:strand:- start:4960 stop:5394 length:435 start_codon:yes stop_codon:yes gene_type:complete